MPRFSVSLGMFFTEVPMLERFARASYAGFGTVEFFWPVGVTAAELERARADAGVRVAMFNMDEGDYVAGERGFACCPGRIEWWRSRFDAALALAKRIGRPQINVLAGNVANGVPRSTHVACLVENLRWAAPRALAAGVGILVEPLNAATHPAYVCPRTSDVLAVLDEVGAGNVTVQYDVYQAQRGEGDIVANLRAYHSQIGHVQLADVPGRGEPGSGELNFPFILRELDAVGYAGHVGLEYVPAVGSADAFSWLPRSARG